MTLIELFPWIVAAQLSLFTGMVLHRAGIATPWVLFIAGAAGVVGLILYRFILSRLIIRYAERHRRVNEADRLLRQYHSLDATMPPNAGLFYECVVCGQTIPSMSKKSAQCTCQNLQIEPGEAVVIRDPGNAKAFSRIAR